MPHRSKKRQRSPDKNEDDELIFAACQALCGNLGPHNGAETVLELLKKEDISDSHKPSWSLERTRQVLKQLRMKKNESVENLFRILLGNHTSSKQEATAADPRVSTRLFQDPLISLAHVERANEILEQALSQSKNNATKQHQTDDAHHHFQQALQQWPCNPTALQCLANFYRMTKQHGLSYVVELYLAASACAHWLVTYSVSLLTEQHDVCDDDKFLLDTLLQWGAQYSDDAPVSRVVQTSSYMAALMASTLNQHEVAKALLQRFGNNITRLHPNLWNAATEARTDCTDTSSTTQAAFVPQLFPRAIPNDLHQTLLHAFRPDSSYWTQSGYSRNVYYSFWTNWNGAQPEIVVHNAVEHYIVAHVLPRVQSRMSLDTLQGFEWWVHTRPQGANLGHQLHFDTDEALLEQDQMVDFPMSASVTYLTAGGGATVLLDQTPEATDNASRAWILKPQPQALLLFPGNLLHGVLPCRDDNDNNTKMNDFICEPRHRLTFMVNFWHRSIPDRIRTRKLYGPSGPFPPATRQHSWIHDICTPAYPHTLTHNPSPALERHDIACVRPAWDTIRTNDGDAEALDPEWRIPSGQELELPSSSSGIYQRFFVKDAPAYFQSTLFEK